MMVTLAAQLSTWASSLFDSILLNTLGLFRLEALGDAEEKPGGPELYHNPSAPAVTEKVKYGLNSGQTGVFFNMQVGTNYLQV